MNKTYDLIIIGGGAAGLVAAKLARGLGKTVAIIEQAKLGGECTWNGCVPSKTLITIAAQIAATKKAAPFYAHPNNSAVNSTKIMAHIRAKRNEIYQTHTPEMLATFGIDVHFGHPTFIDSTSIQVDNKLFNATKFIIATGSRPFVPPIPGLETVPYLTNTSIFDLPALPKSMMILGGGPIGIEIACALNKLGVQVTIINKSPTILPKEDYELSNMLSNYLEADGIILRNSSETTSVQKLNGITCTLKTENITENDLPYVDAESLLIAAGRKPNIEHLNLEKLGVATTPQGITVNTKMQTTVPNIYACGDVVGPYQFSHMAEYQATIATQNAFIPLFKKQVNYNNVIWVTFSDPELATAGITEAQARAIHGNSIKIYSKKYASLDRAKIDEAERGMCKIICDKHGYILGAHILGARAGELIHEIQLGKYYNLRIWDFYKPIHAYPTYSELIWHIAKQAYVQKIQDNFFVKLAKKFFIKQK